MECVRKSLALAGVLIAGLLVGSAGAASPKVTAQSAILMDAQTGEVLWSKKPDARRAPASTTKIVTTVLALESGRLDERFKVSSRAQAQVPSKIHLKKGQQISLRDLSYALMLKSANDGAVVVAEGLGGSVEKFARKMDARAKKAGATNTTFRNPSGLTHSKHLSTARDLAHIMRDALDVPGFRKVAGTSSRKIKIRSKKTRTLTVSNKNRLHRGYFASVVGKTGYTRAAGRCFAGAATYEGREVIVVILGSRDLWGDTQTLIEWAHRGDGRDAWPKVQMASVDKKKTTPAKAGIRTASAAKAKAPPPTARAPKAKATTPTRTASAPTKAEASAAGLRVPPAPAVAREAPGARSVAVASRRTNGAGTSAARSGGAGTYVRSAALVERAPRARTDSAAIPDDTRVAAAPKPVPAYVRSYVPRGNVRRGCTGTGCSRNARYWPAR
jgi:D-alanyl-D-alanine carboxypeptidase